MIIFLYGCSCAPFYKSVPAKYVDLAVVENYDTNIRQTNKLNNNQEVYIKKICVPDLSEKDKKTISYLAISGGSDNGAYAAGFLNGWSKTKTRPKFQIVTGVSTGAIIAPFAFLGKKYDKTLEEIYTCIEQDNVLAFSLLDIFDGITGGLAITDTSPLKKNLEIYITDEIVKEIAAENKKGRKLYISTTNLVTENPVIWDLGEIAASGQKDSRELIINVILASSAMPGVFPPVFFDVNVNGKHYKELHVDGGVVSQMLLPPETYTHECNVIRKMYLIRNSKLYSEYKIVRPRVYEIFSRSISSVIKYQAYGDLYRMYIIIKNNNIDYNLAFIPEDFHHERENTVIDKKYMNALFKRAYKDASRGYKWKKNPF